MDMCNQSECFFRIEVFFLLIVGFRKLMPLTFPNDDGRLEGLYANNKEMVFQHNIKYSQIDNRSL